MPDASIPVDLFNPGQVFACLGFLEAADVLLGDAEGGFDWTDETKALFQLKAEGSSNPFATVLEFLVKADVSTQAPLGSELTTNKWNIQTEVIGNDAPYPYPVPESPATLPAKLLASQNSIVIDYWADALKRTGRDNAKFWAGSGGYPGAALARDALDLIRETSSHDCLDPFAICKPQSSSFRFDWRRDYIPIDAGFSPNDHGDIRMMGFPLVEILAAIGLGNARPLRVHKLEYRYSVIGKTAPKDFHSPIFMRAALGCSKLPFPQRFFRMRLGWPGKENQARCITNITEER
jgi:CRISPR-associated protein Csb3